MSVTMLTTGSRWHCQLGDIKQTDIFHVIGDVQAHFKTTRHSLLYCCHGNTGCPFFYQPGFVSDLVVKVIIS